MIHQFNKNKSNKNKIFIDKEFPKDKINNIFSPYLNMYLNSKYLLMIQFDNFLKFLKKIICNINKIFSFIFFF